jgi:hypothetical protein
MRGPICSVINGSSRSRGAKSDVVVRNPFEARSATTTPNSALTSSAVTRCQACSRSRRGAGGLCRLSRRGVFRDCRNSGFRRSRTDLAGQCDRGRSSDPLPIDSSVPHSRSGLCGRRGGQCVRCFQNELAWLAADQACHDAKRAGRGRLYTTRSASFDDQRKEGADSAC